MLARSLAYVRALPDHSLLDRIIRGRVWIPLLGVLLAGIVAMQVEVLKLNAGIGRALDRSTALQGQNELLRASVAGLADDQRIESLAARMGMVMPTPASIKFLAAGGTAQTVRALSSIHAPDATNFVAQLVASGAAPTAPTTSVAAQGTAAPGPSTGVPSTSPSAPAPAGSSASATTAPSTVSPGAVVTSPTTTTTAPASTGSPAPPPSSTTPAPPVTGAPATGGSGSGAPATGGSGSGAGGGVALSTAAATSTGG